MWCNKGKTKLGDPLIKDQFRENGGMMNVQELEKSFIKHVNFVPKIRVSFPFYKGGRQIKSIKK